LQIEGLMPYTGQTYQSTSEQVVRQLYQAITKYKSFKTTTTPDVYAQGYGRENIICIQGDIYSNFMGNSYPVPIKVDLVKGFPFYAPRVFILLPPGSMIVPSPNIVNTNEVSLPYLVQWNPQQSNLSALLDYVTATFCSKLPLAKAESRPTGFQPHVPGAPQP
jgi:hypothetical protein